MFHNIDRHSVCTCNACQETIENIVKIVLSKTILYNNKNQSLKKRKKANSCDLCDKGVPHRKCY